MRVSLATGRRVLGCICLVFMFAFDVLAQQVTVTRPVNLRPSPATTDPRIELLQPGSHLTLVDSTPQNSFYRVKAADGKEGWVWSKNVTPIAALAAIIPQSTECDDSLWDHLYNPQRLIVKQQCVAVTGTIVDATKNKEPDGVRHEPDGDTHGWLDLDRRWQVLSRLEACCASPRGGALRLDLVRAL
jgi:hypothetical protein